MTSSPHGPYVQGYTRATMVGTKGCDTARWSQSHKADLSSDWSLQLDSMKLESLVIADQHAVTPRESIGPEVRELTLLGGSVLRNGR
jgi:hypothetical protein